jgi:hypothetical protein
MEVRNPFRRRTFPNKKHSISGTLDIESLRQPSSGYMNGVKTLEGFHSLIWCIFCPTLVAITLGEEVGYAQCPF